MRDSVQHIGFRIKNENAYSAGQAGRLPRKNVSQVPPTDLHTYLLRCKKIHVAKACEQQCFHDPLCFLTSNVFFANVTPFDSSNGFWKIKMVLQMAFTFFLLLDKKVLHIVLI